MKSDASVTQAAFASLSAVLSGSLAQHERPTQDHESDDAWKIVENLSAPRAKPPDRKTHGKVSAMTREDFIVISGGGGTPTSPRPNEPESSPPASNAPGGAR